MQRFGLLLVLLVPSLHASEEEARAWLDRMARAPESVSYEGTFVFRHGDEIDTVRILHGSDTDGVREWLVSLNGEAREVIREHDTLTCIWPDSKYVVVGGGRKISGVLANLPANAKSLEANYDFRLAGDDRVAGHDCRQIEVVPKDRYRYGYRFCVERESGLLLSSVMLGSDEQPIEQVLFTSLEILDRVPRTRFQTREPAETVTWQSSQAVETQVLADPDPGWRVSRMPSGFRVSGTWSRPLAPNGSPVQHMVLSDGLATVSVFIAPSDLTEHQLHGRSHSGATNAFSRDIGKHEITVVGEAPWPTVEMIGQSVEHRAQ